jgi:molybdopterin converting factor subunit 1
VKILFFAKSRELVGKIQDYLTLPIHVDGTLLKETILSTYPSLSAIADNIVLAVNQDYIEDEEAELNLVEGDEVAVIPPISGG